MALEDRWPVVVGVAQRVQRDIDPGEALDPMALMEAVAAGAAEDACLNASALESLDRVVVPRVLGASYSNEAHLLAERIGASAAHFVSLGVGGNGPQMVINQAARDVAAGRAEFVLLASAEALDTRQRARAAGLEVDWSGGGAVSLEREPPPSSDLEIRHRLMLPPFIYPLYENALRAHHGRTLEEHRRKVGALLARFTETAAKNPYAWFRTARSADEITQPSPTNRMVAFPYTKYMNAMLRVDQAAAVLVTSAGRARALGIPPDRSVHWLGGGDTIEDPWHVSERSAFHSSPAMARAFASSFAESGLMAEDVHVFDLYSCFPSAVEMACDTLGIPIDDPRPLTVTGGLPYAGGPGNGYGTHGIAQLVSWLRATPGAVGMSTGLGWYFSKHSAGLYGTLPPMELPAPPPSPEPDSSTSVERVRLAGTAQGRGRIETYTVVHDRDGEPKYGIVVGRLEDDRRFLSFLDGGSGTLASLEDSEGIGRTGTVRTDGEVNRFALDD